MRKIYLDKLRLSASIGILEHELVSTQPLFISIVAELASEAILPKIDEVSQVLDYRFLRNTAIHEASQGHINMLETLAGRIATKLLNEAQITAVTVRVDKPNIFTDCDSVAVEVSSKKDL